MENEKKWFVIYWIGAIFQMSLVCMVKFILKLLHVTYPGVFSLVFLAIGGTSSALWGIIVSKKSGRIRTYKGLLKEYFNIFQPIKMYGIVVVFLLILFGIQIITGQTVDGIIWYMFPLYFIQSILFGGIEEIGWRYTFQPLVEKYVPFEVASVITFLSWGIWHYLYFYITDSIEYINHASFLIGLLVSSFVLGAIYRIGGSLWLCVMYHCLLNMFSQTMMGNSLVITMIGNVICIVGAIVLVRKKSGML